MSARHTALKPSWRGVPMIVAARRLGLASNLRLCLDAGDDASYASGQSWLDTSGNGYDFFRGADGSATATDPTFNGTAGARSASEYFSFDGGDYFTYDTTNETWMQNLHKDNAIFTAVAWFYCAAVSGSIFGTSTAQDTGIGTDMIIGGAATTLVLGVRKGTGGSALAVISSDLGLSNMATSAWSMCSVSVNEGATTGIMGINGSFATFTSTYTSPASGNASNTMQIGAAGNAQRILPNNSRLASLMMWEGRALSQGELQALFQATRGRFGV